MSSLHILLFFVRIFTLICPLSKRIEILCFCLNFAHSLICEKSLHLIFELIHHVLIIRILFQSVIFSIQKSFYIILMVFWRTLSIHLRVVVEKVGIYFIEKPRLFQKIGLHKNEKGRRNPIDKSSSRPLMSKGKMQKLENLEKGTETIHKPVLIIFSDSSLNTWLKII